MAWGEAHDQIVSIVKAVTPTTTKMSMPEKFRHVPEGYVSQALPDSRSFFVDLVGPLAMKGHVTVNLPRWLRYGLDIVTVYRRPQNLTEMQKIIAADHIAIVTALADQANWGQPSSTIQQLFIRDGDLFGVVDVDPIEVDGELVAVLTRQHLMVEFTDS